MEMLSTLNEASVESLDSLKESTNKQKNQSVLDNLGENADGQLTYKGNSIGTSSLTMIKMQSDYVTGLITDINMSMTFQCAALPSNARVRKIEIPDVVNGTDEYLNIEDMISVDPNYRYDAPYYVMYPKGLQGDFFPVAAIVVFTVQTNSFHDAMYSNMYEGKTIKVYYEIEE